MNRMITAFPKVGLRLWGFFLLWLLAGLLLSPSGAQSAPQSPQFPSAATTLSTSADVPDRTEESAQPPGAAEREEAVNLLLIGHDSQEGSGNTRSDTILLCTVYKQEKQLILTSILRDLYVEIPGHGKNRINAAYAFGGRELLKQTLEENLGISVDATLEVDFERFAEIVDTLVGVALVLTREEARAINKSTSGDLSEGANLLNGRQALAYVRIRKLDADGDFSRTDRQRRLLTALLTGIQGAKPRTLLSLLKQLLPLVTADVTGDSLFSLALEMIPMLRQLEITGQHIPAEGTYTYETIRGMSVLVADLEAASQLLKQTQAGIRP